MEEENIDEDLDNSPTVIAPPQTEAPSEPTQPSPPPQKPKSPEVSKK